MLIFISGLFSTFQVLSFHGITVFSWFLLLMLFLGLAEKRGLSDINLWNTKEILIGLVLLTMTATELITVFLNDYPEWKSRSLNNYILMAAVFLLFFILRENERYRKVYLKGIMISCVVQYLACYLEYIIFTLFDLDITQKLFDVETKLKDNRPTIVGLTTNPGMMVPVILIGLCLSSRLFMKIMALSAILLVNSTTCVLCVAFFFGVFFIYNIIKKTSNGWNFGLIAFTLTALAMIAFILYEPLRTKTISLYSYALNRINSASTLKSNDPDGSTFVHFRYYRSAPYIFDHLTVIRRLFGFGKNCSGIPFIEFYNQYADGLWIPESDPIATLYDVGIFGFAAFYALLGKITLDVSKKNAMHGIFMLCVIFGGIFYGFQMTWVLLLELLLWEDISSSDYSDTSTTVPQLCKPVFIHK